MMTSMRRVFSVPVDLGADVWRSPRTSLPDSYICPISLSLMRDPVILSDGHSYDRASIDRWLQSHSTSPLTNEPLEHRAVVPNHALRGAIHEFVALHGDPDLDCTGTLALAMRTQRLPGWEHRPLSATRPCLPTITEHTGAETTWYSMFGGALYTSEQGSARGADRAANEQLEHDETLSSLLTEWLAPFFCGGSRMRV
jgi:hypothetical protein